MCVVLLFVFKVVTFVNIASLGHTLWPRLDSKSFDMTFGEVRLRLGYTWPTCASNSTGY